MRDRVLFHMLDRTNGKADRLFVKILPRMYLRARTSQGRPRETLEVIWIRRQSPLLFGRETVP